MDTGEKSVQAPQTWQPKKTVRGRIWSGIHIRSTESQKLVNLFEKSKKTM